MSKERIKEALQYIEEQMYLITAGEVYNTKRILNKLKEILEGKKDEKSKDNQEV